MLYLIAALLILIADQALKYYITLNIPLGEGVVTLIPNIMSLVHFRNTGAAFSMLSGGGARWAFVVLAVAFTAAAVYMILHRTIKSPMINWAMVLVSAGAVGNAIDRAFYGYVVDMFRTDFMNFAIFNVADIFICVGGFFLCLGILLMPDDSKKEKAPAAEASEEIDGEEVPEVRQETVNNLRLFSSKAPLPEEVQESRRTGKLFKEKPVNAENPFAEFEKMPATFDKPKKDSISSEEMQDAERVAKQLSDEMSIDALLKEFGDGEY
ncbi:MAG: signal peptidase II [Oscillospiraceae bacterium]|nr:signal peptidase II [Oscillospiraceae bacterium]